MAPVNDNPLGGLIEREIQTHEGLSYRTLAARVPGRLTKSDVSDFVNKVNVFIRPEKLMALADALGKPLPLVVDAALATMGLDEGRARTIEDAIRADGSLDELTKRRVLALIAEARAAAEEVPEAAMEVRPGDTPPGVSEEPET